MTQQLLFNNWNLQLNQLITFNQFPRKLIKKVENS